MKRIIQHIKRVRKRAYLTNSYKGQYAFVGIGNHSIHNLYPGISFLKLNLTHIVTQSKKTANLVDDNFPNVCGTTDLESVLNNDEIRGIFISATPDAHFELVKKSLQANKNVFVEKPPCLHLGELQELIEIEQKSQGKCFVGLQKQYAPVNLELKKHLGKKCSYNYRYLTGAYPEGDADLDLFIHPVSLSIFLFGKAEIQFVSNYESKSGESKFVCLQHQNGSKGVLELSTDYSWANASESLIVNTEKGIFEMLNTEDLTFKPKQGSFMNVPKEKIFGSKTSSLSLKKRNNFTPVFENNQLVSSGYYSEIENFVKFCEDKKHSNNSSLQTCLNAYEVLEKFKETC